MKYDARARVYGWAFGRLLKGYLRENAPGVRAGERCREVKREYRAMLKRTPGIGGAKNEANLVGACYFFSMAKAIPGLSPQSLDDFIAYCMDSRLMELAYRGMRKRGTLFSEKEQCSMLEEAEKSHRSAYELDWEFTYCPGQDEFTLTYGRCGVCALAKLEGVEAYLPCMCRMDFPKYRLMGARLQRTKTLAEGEDCCDFHVVRDRPSRL